MLFVDGSENKVGIGTNTPVAVLHVSGNIWASGSSGHITASGNISASGDLVVQNITASGNISASGTIKALSYNIGNYNLANINGSELRHGFDSTLTSFMYGKDGTEAHYFNGNVTASGI
jgi:lipid-binding SYLF domain-containing protein